MRANWPELTKRPPGTHKLRQGLSENLSTRVSAHSANPTGISVEAGSQLSNPIRYRFGVYEKQVIPDTPRPSSMLTAVRAFWRIPAAPHRSVLILSAYAYQDALSLVPAVLVSAELAAAVGQDCRRVPLGRYNLRGVREARAIYGLESGLPREPQSPGSFIS